MPGKNTRTEDCFWLLGSLCNLYRIPFDAALVASQFPPPYTLATFHEAARALGFKTGVHPLPSDGWQKLPFPCIAFLKPQAPNETSHTEAPPGDHQAILTCYRYIELNPVRAGMVEDASGYRWSSYGAHALGQADELIRDHPCYLALGATDEARQAAYQTLFRHQVDEASLKAIREAVNSGTALGSERFKDEIEATLARSVRLGTPGRPRKNRISGSVPIFP